MRTNHIIKQSEKCLSVLEAIQRAEVRELYHRSDATDFKKKGLGFEYMVEWELKRADRLAAISQRLQRYYFSQNSKLQEMILKQQARATAADIWEQTKAEVEP